MANAYPFLVSDASFSLHGPTEPEDPGVIEEEGPRGPPPLFSRPLQERLSIDRSRRHQRVRGTSYAAPSSRLGCLEQQSVTYEGKSGRSPALSRNCRPAMERASQKTRTGRRTG